MEKVRSMCGLPVMVADREITVTVMDTQTVFTPSQSAVLHNKDCLPGMQKNVPPH